MSRYKLPYTIYKRGKYWYYRSYTRDGKRGTAHSTGCTSKNDARQFCEKLFLDGVLGNSTILFKHYASDFYDDESVFVADRTVPITASTLKIYRSDMNRAILPYWQNYKLDEITYSKLKEFRCSLLEKYKIATVKHIMNTLKQIIDAAYKDGKIKINPFSYLEPIREEKKIKRDSFTIDEVKYFIDNMGNQYKYFCLLLTLTGMRYSEAIEVKPTDIIHSDKGFDYILLNRQRYNGEIVPLKTKDSRVIPIIPEIKDFIIDDDFDRADIYKKMNYVRDQIENGKERNLTFHSLRHFFSTNAKSFGIPSIKVEAILGHKLSDSQMESVYTHFHAEDLTEILEWQKETLKKITTTSTM